MKLPSEWTAFLLLIVGLVHNTAWSWFDASAWGGVYKITAALLILYLLVAYARLRRSWPVWVVTAFLASYALQAAGCELAYFIQPWPHDPTKPMCSQRTGLPLTMLGLAWACALAGWLKGRTSRKT